MDYRIAKDKRAEEAVANVKKEEEVRLAAVDIEDEVLLSAPEAPDAKITHSDSDKAMRSSSSKKNLKNFGKVFKKSVLSTKTSLQERQQLMEKRAISDIIYCLQKSNYKVPPVRAGGRGRRQGRGRSRARGRVCRRGCGRPRSKKPANVTLQIVVGPTIQIQIIVKKKSKVITLKHKIQEELDFRRVVFYDQMKLQIY